MLALLVAVALGAGLLWGRGTVDDLGAGVAPCAVHLDARRRRRARLGARDPRDADRQGAGAADRLRPASYGPAWKDVDRNGCDTRNDVLRRDLRDVELKPGTHGCVVLSGVLLDPYSGEQIDFVRGSGTSARVQVDHVVALADAWQKGAQQWTTAQREAFANDPLELLATSGPVNQAKGDGDAATWLPPQQGFRCAYVARQVAVKARYHLSVTPAEKNAIDHVLQSCSGQPRPQT